MAIEGVEKVGDIGNTDVREVDLWGEFPQKQRTTLTWVVAV